MSKSKPAPYHPAAPRPFRVGPLDYLLLAVPAAVRLLALAAIALLIPAAHSHLHGRRGVGTLSEEIAVVLLIVYSLSLLFTLRTHSHLFAGPEGQLPTTGEHHQPEWGRRTSLLVLTV